MVLSKKQTQWSVEKNREPRNGSLTLWSTNLWQRIKEYSIEKRLFLQQMMLGKLDNNLKKNETGPFSYTILKNRPRMDERPKCEIRIHQHPRGESRQQPHSPWPQQLSAWCIFKSKENKGKNELLGLHQDKNFCTAIEVVNKTKRQPTDWEKIFANVLTDKGLVSKIYK